VACGGGRRRAWRRRCGLGEGARGGEGCDGGDGLRDEPIYRRGKAEEGGAAVVADRTASSAEL